MRFPRVLSYLLPVILLAFFSSCSTDLDRQRKMEYINSPMGLVMNEERKADILNNNVVPGMPRDQVVASWGEPDDIQHAIGDWGRSEKWVYLDRHTRDPEQPEYFLYFKNGVLRAWKKP